MSEPAIRAVGLVKRFGETVVLDGIDLSIERGAIFGWLGPNGAGKTTTVRLLAGLDTEFEGQCAVGGLDPRRDPLALKRKVGYLPENAVLYEALTIAEFLLFVGRMRGLEDEVIRERGSAMLESLELEDRLSSRIQSLSKGMRQKVLLTASVLHAPEILFVDEPLSGLDANAAVMMKKFFRRYADAGRTIFYCSHVMDVVERICDRIAILHRGKIVVEGPFDELARKAKDRSLEAIFGELTSQGGEEERIERMLAALGPALGPGGGSRVDEGE